MTAELARHGDLIGPTDTVGPAPRDWIADLAMEHDLMPPTAQERAAYAQPDAATSTALQQISQARQLLELAKDLTDIKAIRDMAEAARLYARAVGLGQDAMNEAAEIKLRAERKAGEVLAGIDKHPGGRPRETCAPGEQVSEAPPKLADIGITRKQAAHWQAEASLSEEVFESYVTEVKRREEPLTTAGVVQVARAIERGRRAAEPRPVVDPTTINAIVDIADACDLPIDNDSVDLIVTSPPYGVGVEYEDGGDIPAAEWPAFMRAWLGEAYRVSKPRGRLALNVALDTTRGGNRPIYADAVQAAVRAGWTYYRTISWQEGNTTKGGRSLGSVNSSARPSPVDSTEVIALFCKQEWGPTTENPDDITPEEWQVYGHGPWTFSGESRPHEGHPAPFPEELPRRVIRYLSRVGDVVLDPFCGSGTTVAVAAELGRQAMGYDRSRAYVESTLRRVAAKGLTRERSTDDAQAADGAGPVPVGEASAGPGVPAAGSTEVLAGGLCGRLDRLPGGAQEQEPVQDGDGAPSQPVAAEASGSSFATTNEDAKEEPSHGPSSPYPRRCGLPCARCGGFVIVRAAEEDRAIAAAVMSGRHRQVLCDACGDGPNPATVPIDEPGPEDLEDLP